MKGFATIVFCLSAMAPLQAQRYGIKGQLYWATPESSGTRETVTYSGVPLEIYVHGLTSVAEVDIVDGAISKIYTPVVDRFFCKWDGSFKARLPAGSYSVFVRYQNRYYGNLQDANGNLSPVTMGLKRNEWITITIDYPPPARH
ncbi:MAG TPA: hypothetical protein PKW06_10185 [Cyclobacteriaceae bacterium]|nr:hypothetical protein [Cyclobacteriaceae bacterium]MCB9236878.1 hypothetical protein [Flammeovirgaceae bacterium]MCB0498555.1 hypothetical protein [Cyclobacteriaceae bacterium]MCO5271519.1 hypothetical protein [Cyclobacteriaceae bacterium]MCW5901415.1 hypothetical protein [Cyclobacteriaceae bacterium]